MGLFSQKPKDKYKALHPDSDRHTRPNPGRRTSETAVNAPSPGHHGPHFHQGPAQDDIWNRRQQSNQEVSYEDICGRSHSFHNPIKQPEYSNPYEKRPVPWTPRMKQEYADYKVKVETYGQNESAVNKAKTLPIGRKHSPEASQGRQIMTAVDLAIEGRIQASTASQARAGFQHKYPQAYEERGIKTHWKEATQARDHARDYRDDEAFLRNLHGKWEHRMGQYEQQQMNRGSSSRR